MSIRLKDTIYNTANYSTDSDKLDGYDSSHYMQYKSASTPATAQWYRIAQTGSGISNNIGIFEIYGSTSGYHTDVILEAGTSYGNTAGTTLVQTSCAAYSSQNLTKARIVYHTSYSGNYAYLEVYLSCSAATTIYVKFQGHGWTLVAPNTVGSIPSGYSTKEITFTKDAVVAKTFVGALSGNASTATSATTATSAGKLTTARTISLTGSVTGSGSFDGSGNLSIATTTNHSHSYASKVTVGTTAYSVSSNNITIPAYPTLSSLGAAASSHTHNYAASDSAGGPANLVKSHDTRSVTIAPDLYGPTLSCHFKQNGTNGVSDGGNYFGLIHFRPYGSATDFSGGYPHQIAFTENNNLWHRKATSSTAWGTWYKILDSNNSSVSKSGETLTVKINGTSQSLTNTNTTYSAGTGISLSGTTFSNSGVRSIATGTSNGTISVNTNGTTANVAVKGLGSAAYTASTAYAAASHTHTKSQITDFSHTHSYAGSSSAGGPATSANKLNTDAGSDTSPVYFSGGVPVACGSLDLRKYYRIDASTLSTSNFYPVTFASSDIMTECEIHSPNLGGAQPYNQNVIHFQLIAQGWSDTPKSFKIFHHGVYDGNEITIGAIGSGNEGGMQCVWVRGGMVYRFYSNKKPTLRTANTSNGNEIFTVGTGYSGGSNTKVTIHWSYGQTSQIVCTAGHTHSYAASSHTHTKSQITDFAHTHDYAASNHTHSQYLTSLPSHNHDSVYSKLGHTHSYASSSHTHNYAGSSSAGGAATSANKLNTNAGGSFRPVYFSGGIPVAGCRFEVLSVSCQSSSNYSCGHYMGESCVTISKVTYHSKGRIQVSTDTTYSTAMIWGVVKRMENTVGATGFITVDTTYSNWEVMFSDDASTNWGTGWIYVIKFY